MRSTASIKGHPIHPMLVSFPIAFLTGAFVADLLGRVPGRPDAWRVGAYLAAAGIVTAVMAAVPGAVDYFFTIPPKSSAKRRATYHLSVNLGAVALFATAWLLRGSAAAEPPTLVLLLEGLGLGLLSVGGWLGGTLAFRNQIGVDHRYAEAGKWREQRVEPGRDGVVLAARAGELKIDQMKLLHVQGKRIVLARTDDGYAAFDDHCTHRGGSLADGALICGTVQCPWHGSQFDVHTGQVRNGPARAPIDAYGVEVSGDEIRIHLDERPGKVGGQPARELIPGEARAPSPGT
jgi:nitrite reductase/ring-hydroxylating ferredoxin subunit/uncharacterized membrane protein